MELLSYVYGRQLDTYRVEHKKRNSHLQATMFYYIINTAEAVPLMAINDDAQ